MNAALHAEARVNVTWKGQNGDLRHPVPWTASAREILHMVTEAVRSGDVAGIGADRTADFREFVIDRFGAGDGRPFNVIQVRPKTPFG